MATAVSAATSSPIRSCRWAAAIPSANPDADKTSAVSKITGQELHHPKGRNLSDWLLPSTTATGPSEISRRDHHSNTAESRGATIAPRQDADLRFVERRPGHDGLRPSDVDLQINPVARIHARPPQAVQGHDR